MQLVVSAILPIILLLLTGWALGYSQFIPPEGWASIENLCYWVLIPALLIPSVASADFSSIHVGKYAVVMLGSVTFLIAILMALHPLLQRYLGVSGASWTSLAQGTIRWNGFITLAVATKVLEDTGVSLIAIAFAILTPFNNLLCVLLMILYTRSHAISLQSVLGGVLKNPFILSVLVGLVLNVTHIPLPEVLDGYLTFLSSASVPMAILCVGAAIDLRMLRKPNFQLITGVAFRLLIAPAVALVFATLLEVDETLKLALVIVFAGPTAGSAYILSRKMGGDYALMAQIIAAQTILAALTYAGWLIFVID
ncbi:AEC family transporter [Flexibacterium corallicola]|uniref:AEC family transporter n=1 Tax=Flexibacterium corallicola TaxID=3037259 RepID=UPI00286EE4EA|nr:AEC family transporter [Pseudovibrio sp. M1P-2-3]